MNSNQENRQGRETDAESFAKEEADRERSIRNRRLMVRGAAAAVPAILSLRSGAALARSSNLVSTVADLPETGGTGGVYHCLDTESVEPVGANLYDLGTQGDAHFTNIRADRRYFDEQGTQVSPAEMCQRGGDYRTESSAEDTSFEEKAEAEPDFLRQSFIPMANGEGETVAVAQGGLVSATAFASIAARTGIRITEI